MSYRLGVDVGETFTDLLLIDEDSGDLHRTKTPSTPVDPSQGVLVGVKSILKECNVAPQDISHGMHGTHRGHQCRAGRKRSPAQTRHRTKPTSYSGASALGIDGVL